MQARLIELHEQRGRLRERIAHQRETLADQVQPLRATLAIPERLGALLGQGRTFVASHPYLFGTAAAAVAVFKPRLVWRWAKRGVVLWRAWRGLRRLLPDGLLGVLRDHLMGRQPPGPR